MTHPLRSLRALAARELRDLTTFNASNRPWQMPVAAAAAIGLPLMIGAATGYLAEGLTASLGGLVFLYLPATSLSHRMAWLMACGFAMAGSYTLGLLSQLLPGLTVPVLAAIAMLVTMVCRYYAVPPPGSLFFIMAASIGAYTPVSGAAVPLQVGLLTMGAVLACLIAFFYSLSVARPAVAAPVPRADFDFVVLDSVVIGACVGLSLALAQLLQLPRPYWVPVSCLAVIQGATLRAVWNRQLQRIAGTGVGLLAFWAIAAALPLGPWSVALAVTGLSLVIEVLVVRHYGLAVVFITPLTIFLAEAATLPASPPQGILQARFIDTALGCAIGLAGGIGLHSPRFRAAVARLLRVRIQR